jgi:hypothetical protein
MKRFILFFLTLQNLFFFTSCATPALKKNDLDLKTLYVEDSVGKKVMLSDLTSTNGLVLIAHSAECPIVRRYTKKIEEIRSTIGKQQVNLVYLNTFDKDQKQIVEKYRNEYKVETPIFYDDQNSVTHALKLERTSEAVYVDQKGNVVYRGAIDDGLDYEASRPSQNQYLMKAVQSQLAQSKVILPYVPAKGCALQ